MAEITELNVDYDSVEKALETFMSEVSQFTDSHKEAFRENLANMEAMNSDFVEVFVRALKKVRLSIGYQILSEIEYFRQQTNEAIKNLQTADEAHSQERVEESNGSTEL